MPTQFSDFRAYSGKEARHLYQAIDDYLPVADNWSDLEAALAALDVETVIDDLIGFMPSYCAGEKIR